MSESGRENELKFAHQTPVDQGPPPSLVCRRGRDTPRPFRPAPSGAKIW